MNNLPVAIAILSAIAASVSALGSRRSSRIALMANGPGVEVSAGVYQRDDDTIGWVVLTNVGGSEARDIYLELFADSQSSILGLAFDRELPLIIWHQPFLRRGSSAQINMPMMVFRELGLKQGSEVEPFNHFWISYTDRLGRGHGFHAAVDYMAHPIDVGSLEGTNVAERGRGQAAVQISAPPTFELSTLRTWKRFRIVIPLVRRLFPRLIKLPSPKRVTICRMTTKVHKLFATRSIEVDFPDEELKYWPVFAVYSEDKRGKVIWHGTNAGSAGKVRRLLASVSGAIGDVEIVEFAAGGREVARTRSRVSFDALLLELGQIN